MFTRRTQKEARQSFRRTDHMSKSQAAALVFVYINYMAYKPVGQVQANTKNCEQ